MPENVKEKALAAEGVQDRGEIENKNSKKGKELQTSYNMEKDKDKEKKRRKYN